MDKVGCVRHYQTGYDSDCGDCIDDNLRALLKQQDKKAITIMKNIADGFDERGHFLQKFARMFMSATDKNKECLLPAAHRLIETWDIEKGQREKGILTEVQYM